MTAVLPGPGDVVGDGLTGAVRPRAGLRLVTPRSRRSDVRSRRHAAAVLLVLGDAAAGWAAAAVATGAGGWRAASVAAVWVLVMAGQRCYEPPPATCTPRVRRVALAGAGLALALAVDAAVRGEPLTAPQLLGIVAAASLASAAPRAALERRASARRAVPVVVAGHRRDVARVLAEMSRGRARGLRPVAVCVPRAGGTGLGVPEVVGFASVPGLVALTGARAVIVVPCRHLDPLTLRRLHWQLEASGASLLVASGLLDVAARRAEIGHAGDLPLVQVRRAELAGARRALLNVTERAAAALALLALAPVLLGLLLAVRVDSPGPALFLQERVGRHGRHFTMLKLRTMVVDAEQRRADLAAHDDGNGVLFKMRSDPRVTRLGRSLRRFSLDELPQLVNVVLGHMSLVGPRPALPSEVAAYDADTHRRLAVRPGITGLWQVSGRSDLSWPESVRLDLCYVDNWSVGLDLRILLLTLRAVLRSDGAY